MLFNGKYMRCFCYCWNVVIISDFMRRIMMFNSLNMCYDIKLRGILSDC